MNSARGPRVRPRLQRLEDRDVPATFAVTTAADSGAGSLRQAILDANAAGGFDEIVFGAGVIGQTITLSSTLPTITDTTGLQITGPDRTSLTVSGNEAVRVFDVAAGASATISGLTITRGNAGSGAGGGVRNLGTLVLNNVGVTLSAAAEGGGIANEIGGTLTLNRVTVQTNQATGISGNPATASGGGVRNLGTFAANASSVTGNTSVGAGGGILHGSGTLALTNTTVAGNSALGGTGGGGLKVLAAGVTLINSTVVGNTDGSTNAARAGGISSTTPTLTLRNTIVSLNTAAAGTDPNVDPAVIASSQNNFLGGEPQLGPLTDNGSTLSMTPLSSASPVVDTGATAAVPVGVTTDQRGFLRVVGPSVDIGAVEFQPPAVSVTLASSLNPSGIGQPVTFIATVTPTGTAPNNVPVGTVVFTINGVPLAPVTLNSGRAGVTVTTLTLGTHTVQATYSGDGNFATGTGTLTPAQEVTLTPPPPNTPPTISGIANQSVNTGQSTGPVAFTVSDAATPADQLVVTAVSSDPVLFPASGIVLGGSGTDRTITVTPAAGLSGAATITVTVQDAGGLTSSAAFTVTVAAPVPGLLAVGAGAGGSPQLKVLGSDGTQRLDITVFPGGFSGGVRTATGDFNGDGTEDVVVGAGPGAATTVRVLDGLSGAFLGGFQAFESSFAGGVFLAAADFNGDGIADVAVSPDQGGGPRVRVISGADFTTVLADFFGIDDPSFRGGARVAAGDINRDGTPDLLVAAGFGGGPRLAVFDGTTVGTATPTKPFGDFFVFEDTLRNGVFLAAGDINGDGFADLIAGGGPGGGPRVFGLSGQGLLANQQVQLANFFAGNPDDRGGIRVAATDLNRDGRADLATGAGEGSGSRVTAYSGLTIPTDGAPSALFSQDAFPGFAWTAMREVVRCRNAGVTHPTGDAAPYRGAAGTTSARPTSTYWPPPVCLQWTEITFLPGFSARRASSVTAISK